LPSLISSTLHTSSLLRPSTSRSVTTSRWRSGSSLMAERSRPASLAASSRSSASSTQRSGGVAQWPVASNRDRSTAGPASPIATLRRSRAPAVRARFTRIANIQVLTDERPSNPPMPRSTPSQVSWTTSSATAMLGTYPAARESIAAWWRRTRVTKACSSPARRRASNSASGS
jgi:hypothetical protein